MTNGSVKVKSHGLKKIKTNDIILVKFYCKGSEERQPTDYSILPVGNPPEPEGSFEKFPDCVDPLYRKRGEERDGRTLPLLYRLQCRW